MSGSAKVATRTIRPVDEEELRTVMRKVQRSVARFSRNDAEDITQEAMLRALQNGIDGDAEPWLRTVAKRIAIDRARRDREVSSGATDEMDRISGSTSLSLDDIFTASEDAGVIRKALEALPARYREALVTYAANQNNAEVAERFGISSSATWTLICRARARLRSELNRVGYAAGIIAVRLNRWSQEVATATAVGAVAVGIAISSTPSPADASPETSSAATVSVDAPETAAVQVPLPAPKPIGAAKVQERGPVLVPDDSVGGEVVRYEVKSCLIDDLPVGVHVSVVEDERPSLLGAALEQVPEPVRKIGEKTCL